MSPGPAAEVVCAVEDVDAQARLLAERGATILRGPVDHPWGHRTVHVADPDGFVVEFAQAIPRRRSRHPARDAS